MFVIVLEFFVPDEFFIAYNNVEINKYIIYYYGLFGENFLSSNW